MTQTLQDALLKAGLVTAEKIKKAEQDKKAAKFQSRAQQSHRPATQSRVAAPQPSRTSQAPTPTSARPVSKPRPAIRPQVQPPRGGPGFLEHKHIHHLRTDCDACGKSSPDVEYYEHPNKSFPYFWLCVTCADNSNILDQYRQTKQSQHAMSGVFRRNYGPTKIFR